jgi:hypothetical protein
MRMFISRVRKEIIYLWILFLFVFSVNSHEIAGTFAALRSCCGSERETGNNNVSGTSITDTFYLHPEEEKEFLQIRDLLLGELGIISESELNPAFIETSLREVDILMGTSLILPKDEVENEEAKVKEEIYEELSVKKAVRNFVSDEIVQKFDNIESRLKYANRLVDKYSSLLVSVLLCIDQGNAQNSCLSPQIQDCEIKILGCSLKDYVVSGTIYVSFQGELLKNNYSFSVSVVNVKLENGDKSVTFYSGQVSGAVATDSTTKICSIKIELSKMNISDTEEGIEMSGIVQTQVQLSSYGVSFTRTFESISYKKDRENFIVESGKISAEKGKVDPQSLIISVENLGVRSDDGKRLTLDGIFKKESSKNPTFVSREISANISLSSPVTSFSGEFYRYEKIQKESTQDNKTFSLSITNYVKVEAKTIKLYSHNLTIVKEGMNEFKVSGKTKIAKRDGTEIQINFKNVKAVKYCQNLTSGIILADVKKQDNSVIKVNVYLNEVCSCEHDVEIEKMVNENWIFFKSTGDICEAKKKQENETSNEIIRGAT